MKKILCVGMLTMDNLLLVESYPKEDTAQPVKDSYQALGGSAAKSAVVADALGQSAILIAALGSGDTAQNLLDDLSQTQIDLRLERNEAPASQSTIILNELNSSRTILWTGGEKVQSPQPLFDEINPEEIGIIMLDATDPKLFTATIEYANEHQIPLVLDTGSGRPWVADALPQADYVIAPAKYLQKFLYTKKDNMKELLQQVPTDWGRQILAVSNGSHGGAYRVTGEERIRRWSAHPAKAVDTNGAGDVFHGAFACALLNDFTVPEALDYASEVAALSISTYGNEWLADQRALAELSDRLLAK
ncbi:hypothetical protein BSR29_03870 [Boudabousia liubingyangii]|uniref:Carbohydrate kinase PfkB domain-containing protein n=1 Tax=Boudabousia liubingyangii TaxID=1921764 RepID=A0A1Q5PN52_9ACTO|nr:PfkB family carbohydrate kinase [Boudabousia liubingyangii]OKL48984.1 hypothetical protein BSR29_03870 [Boudabousia liubingyangii]